ncbi:hypothetical protein [Pseudomonas phage D6]|nr:hypothetical protein [Pseudomonas phage D6]
MAKEPFPENLSFEEVLASVAGGALLLRHKREAKPAGAEPVEEGADKLVLKPNPEYLVDVHV